MVRVASVRCLDGYVVELGFTDGATRVLDLAPYLRGPVFFPHRADPTFFRSVTVDPVAGTITWPNETDIDPDVLRWGLEPVEWNDPPDDAHGGDPSIRGLSGPPAPPRQAAAPEPCLSTFFGIEIRLDVQDPGTPCLRARHGEEEARQRLDTLEVLAGTLPRRALSFLVEWIVLHRPELVLAWERARTGLPLQPISPLE
jgi:hypothetical protein